jgi:hypothetical protein
MSVWTNSIAAASLVVASFIGVTASASPVVVNGSFETGVPGNTAGLLNGATYGNMPTSGPSWDLWSGLNGWKQAKPGGIEVQTNPTLSSIDAQNGNYYVELDTTGNSAMFQNVALHVGRYVMSFWYSPRTGNVRSNGINYQLSGLGVVGKADSNTPGASVGQWTQISVAFFVSTAKNYRLTFAASGTSDGYGGLLDNVQIEGVPVPASGFALFGALGGLAALRRRKAAA